MNDDQRIPQTISDPYFDEQFPLSPIDDFLIHQTPDPIRVVQTSDPRAYERYWVVCHDDKGDILLAMGGSFYPNLDTAEAFAIVNYKGQHRSVRAFRRIGADRVNLDVGPIKPTIVQGMRTWRFVLDKNDWGISYDLLWTDTRRQIFHRTSPPVGHARPSGRQGDVMAGFEGFGVVDGWVDFDGQRIKMSSENCKGTRDRHWGIGRGVGGPNFNLGQSIKAGWIGGNWFSFSDFSIWGDKVLYGFGDPRPQMGRVVKVQRRLLFENDTKIFKEGIIDFTLKSGEVKTVQIRRLGFQTAYMCCGLYGGTPDKKIYQGMYVGENVVEGDAYDVAKPDVRRKLSGLNEHHCEIKCGDEVTTGILQPVEPDAYEACRDKLPGWQFLE